jgi:hypothetical protein
MSNNNIGAMIIEIDALETEKNNIDEIIKQKKEILQKQMEESGVFEHSEKNKNGITITCKVIHKAKTEMVKNAKAKIKDYLGVKGFLQIAKFNMSDLRKKLTDDQFNEVVVEKEGPKFLKFTRK